MSVMITLKLTTIDRIERAKGKSAASKLFDKIKLKKSAKRIRFLSIALETRIIERSYFQLKMEFLI